MNDAGSWYRNSALIFWADGCLFKHIKQYGTKTLIYIFCSSYWGRTKHLQGKLWCLLYLWPSVASGVENKLTSILEKLSGCSIPQRCLNAMPSEVGEWRWGGVVVESWSNWRQKYTYVITCLLRKKVRKGTKFFFLDSFRKCFSRGTPIVIKALIQNFEEIFRICQLSFMYSWSVKLAFALRQWSP